MDNEKVSTADETRQETSGVPGKDDGVRSPEESQAVEAEEKEEAASSENAPERAEVEGAEELSPEEEELEMLRQRVAAQDKRIDELSRAYAELLNDRDAFRRRLERESERQLEASRAENAEILFDAMDDLRRAIQNSSGDVGAVTEGVRLIADGLQRRLEGMGLSPIPTSGTFFDPALHEAVDLVPTDDKEQDGKVVDEARGGWKLGERVVRAARVRVARYVPPAEPKPDGEAQ